MLRAYWELGMRYITLTHFNTNTWADASTDAARNNGLSLFGRDVIREMNRLGMVVDISHVSDKTFWDAIEVADKPIMASHSSAWALAQHPRNMKDDMIRAVATNGGVVNVNFAASFVSERHRLESEKNSEEMWEEIEEVEKFARRSAIAPLLRHARIRGAADRRDTPAAASVVPRDRAANPVRGGGPHRPHSQGGRR